MWNFGRGQFGSAMVRGLYRDVPCFDALAQMMGRGSDLLMTCATYLKGFLPEEVEVDNDRNLFHLESS